MNVEINGRSIGPDQPVYFVADLASNHNGELSLAKELVHACAESKVDAVKMQNFTAEALVSDHGFRNLQGVKTHQTSWEKSVYESYEAASIPFDWTLELSTLCAKLGVDYFTSPYSIDLVHAVQPFVSAFKLGSGDITWYDVIRAMAKYPKPLIIATGASAMNEVEAAMRVALAETSNVILLQCNTEYSASPEEARSKRLRRYASINLRVLESYHQRWDQIPLGLSDHTQGATTVLGAVGLFDCSVVEKHFTLDTYQAGQDHSFSMSPEEWRVMVEQTKALKAELSRDASFERRWEVTKGVVNDPEALELALGDGVKRLEANEMNTVIVQRRALRAARNLEPGELIEPSDVVPLRPCPPGAMPPGALERIVGKRIMRGVEMGELLLPDDF